MLRSRSSSPSSVVSTGNIDGENNSISMNHQNNYNHHHHHHSHDHEHYYENHPVTTRSLQESHWNELLQISFWSVFMIMLL